MGLVAWRASKACKYTVLMEVAMSYQERCPVSWKCYMGVFFSLASCYFTHQLLDVSPTHPEKRIEAFKTGCLRNFPATFLVFLPDKQLREKKFVDATIQPSLTFSSKGQVTQPKSYKNWYIQVTIVSCCISEGKF